MGHYFMNAQLYVENIAPATTENELKDLFSTYGNVAEVNIILDRTHQKPRGLGFVTMVTPEGAWAAIQALHGKQIGEHTLTVSETGARKQHTGLPRQSLRGAP